MEIKLKRFFFCEEEIESSHFGNDWGVCHGFIPSQKLLTFSNIQAKHITEQNLL